MPEIDREKLKAKLDTIPEGDREPYLQALKAKGYTWKSNTPEQPKPKADSLFMQAVKSLKPVPMIAGAGLGAEEGAAMGAPLGPVGVGAGALGGAFIGGVSGYAASKAAEQASKVSQGKEAETPSQVFSGALSAGSEMAQAEAMGQIAAGPGLALGKTIAKKGLGQMAEWFGGLSGDTIAMLEKNAPKVVEYARQGYKEASLAADVAARKFQDRLSSIMDRASEEYESNAITAVKDKYGPDYKINLSDGISPKIAEVKKEFGYGDESPLNFTDEADQKKFLKIEAAAKTLNNATPEEVRMFQKRLNDALKDAKGSFKGALGQIKGQVVSTLESTLPEIQKGNEAYKAGAQLRDDLSRVEKADVASRVINNALKAGGKTAEAINKFVDQDPQAREHLNDLMAATAAKPISRWSRFIPENGLKGGLLAALADAMFRGGADITAHPEIAATAAAGLVGSSPRLYGEGFNLLSKVPETMSPRIPAGLEALRRARKKENQ